MSATFEIQSMCECQALLGAALDDNKQVLRGWVHAAGSEDAEPAPANSVGADGERFDVVWKCPVCGRNTLRSFYQGALDRVAAPEPASTP